jgi:hypothetical protein
MQDAPGVQEAIDNYVQQNQDKNTLDDMSPVVQLAGFGLPGLVDAGVNPTRQFIGSYEVYVVPVSQDSIKVYLRNQTSLNSALYHAPFVPYYDRTRNRYGGNMWQTIELPERKVF